MAFFPGGEAVAASVGVCAITVNSVFFAFIARIAQTFYITGADVYGVVGVFVPLCLAADIGLQCVIKH